VIYPATPENISRAAELIRAGHLVAFPTETVYGLGADAFQDVAIAEIYRRKGRPAYNPLIIHISSLEHLDEIAEVGSQFILVEKLARFWPGPLTIILKRKKSVPAIVSAGRDTVAVRVPAHQAACSLIKMAGVPIAAPSANPSGYVSPTTAAHVAASFRDDQLFILDGGPSELGIESTVVKPNPDGAVELLRPGVITREQLEECTGTKVLEDTSSEISSPGMLLQHYAPKTKLLFLSERPKKLPARTGVIMLTRDLPVVEREQLAAYAQINEGLDLNRVAHKLYGTIRDFDDRALDLILVEPCDPRGIGEAILDRLTRARAKFRTAPSTKQHQKSAVNS